MVHQGLTGNMRTMNDLYDMAQGNQDIPSDITSGEKQIIKDIWNEE